MRRAAWIKLSIGPVMRLIPRNPTAATRITRKSAPSQTYPGPEEECDDPNAMLINVVITPPAIAASVSTTKNRHPIRQIIGPRRRPHLPLGGHDWPSGHHGGRCCGGGPHCRLNQLSGSANRYPTPNTVRT